MIISGWKYLSTGIKDIIIKDEDLNFFTSQNNICVIDLNNGSNNQFHYLISVDIDKLVVN